MPRRFTIFLTIVVAFLLVCSVYLSGRFIERSQWAADHQLVVFGVFALFITLQIAGPKLYRSYPQKLKFVQSLSYTTLGIFACLLFYSFAADLILGIFKLARISSDPSRIERTGFLVMISFALGSAIIGVAQAKVGPRIYNVEIPIENLPEEFEGLRIVQVSDLHVGPTIGRKYTQKVVSMVNALEPDIVALTGDFVDGRVAQLQSEIQPIQSLQARYGTFFVTGNHEYYWGAREWLAEFAKLGVQILENQHVQIRLNGSAIVLAGIADLSSHTADPVRALQGAPENTVKILLSHQPGSYRVAEEAGFDLQLSGHTHGGQFFPWSMVVKLVHRFYKGLGKHKHMWVYVSRGTGYWGPPIRFAIPAEITNIRLIRQ
jgi:predicted MPP superfamily phosphohydrolase